MAKTTKKSPVHKKLVAAHQYLAAMKIVTAKLTELGYDDKHCAGFEQEMRDDAFAQHADLEVYANNVIYSLLCMVMPTNMIQQRS